MSHLLQIENLYIEYWEAFKKREKLHIIPLGTYRREKKLKQKSTGILPTNRKLNGGYRMFRKF